MMSLRTLDFKWYDGFFLSMLATSAIVVAINWEKYRFCAYPLHIWIVVDYAVVFIFRILMFADNGLAAGLGPDADQRERMFRLYGRIVVLSCLSLLLYPFLWAWTIIGTLWFTSARTCLPEQGQKWGFIVWLLFSYCGLLCIACMSIAKWFARRRVYFQRSQQMSPTSEFEVLVDLIRLPERVHQIATFSQEMRAAGQEVATYHSGLYLSQAQREAIEALIQQLPKFCLKTVPTECNECPICLDEFRVGTEVRGLPCAHNFHLACIDQWLRLDVRCPRCRCSVFPNLDLSALATPQYPQRLNNAPADANTPPSGPLITTTTTTITPTSGQYVRAHPVGQSNLIRLQEILRTIRMENATPNESNMEETTRASDDLESASLQSTGVHGSRMDLGLDDPSSFNTTANRSPPSRF